MNAAVVVDRVADASPRAMARMAGLFYLLTILAGVFAQGFVSDKLVVFGDAAAIWARGSPWRSSASMPS